MSNLQIEIQKAQSLFEVVFAVSIVALLVTGVVALAATSVRNSTFSRNSSLANRYSEETMEWLREERDTGWDIFKQRANTSTNWCLKSLSWVSPTLIGLCGTSDYIGSTIFRRQVTFRCLRTNLSFPPAPEFLTVACSNAAVDNIEVSVFVIWDDSQGTHEARLITRLANWRK